MNRAKAKEMQVLLNRCRELWNEFDPIGVLEDGDGPRDEYDSYLPQTVKYALSDTDELIAYVRKIVEADMGMASFPEGEIEKFADRVRDQLGA